MPPEREVLRAQVDRLTERVRRERQARDEAETIAESATRRLYIINRELEELVYMAGHALAQPVLALGGLVGLLDEHPGTPLDATQQRALSGCRLQVDRLQALLDALLRHTLTGRDAFDRVSMADVCAAALEALAQEDGWPGADVSVGDLPDVLGAAADLREVWRQVLGNAVKFRRPGSRARVLVEALSEPPMARFVVEDRGLGVDEVAAGKMFELFWQARAPGEEGGTGTGLAIVRKVVERHGGRAWATAASGGGTRLCFTLPVWK